MIKSAVTSMKLPPSKTADAFRFLSLLSKSTYFDLPSWPLPEKSLLSPSKEIYRTNPANRLNMHLN